MAEPDEKRSGPVSKEVIREIRKIAEEKFADLRGTVMKLLEKKDIYLEDSTLLALGISFVLGLAIGVALAKRKE
ncbi:MAG: hypothetical protein QW390_00075 [Candidatus Bathyarchaeia archaeon]